MDKETFLLADRIKQIKSSFIENGWVTIYESVQVENETNILIYCALVNKKRIKEYRNNREWKIFPTSEGKPCISSTLKNEKRVLTYKSYDEYSLEPFIFSKHFNFDGGHDSYIDIAEEFVLYFRLYEKGIDKNNRKFYFIDDSGELDEVIIIEPKKIKVKLKYLKEYIAIRKIYFSVCYDIIRYADVKSINFNFQFIDEDFKSNNYYYNHYISPYVNNINKLQSWIHGKAIIDYDKTKSESHYFNSSSYKYEEFITGYDNNGKEILESCTRTDEKYFKITYFKKEVLNKYYNDPDKYAVDGFCVSSGFFHLKIDNNHEEYVAVFLVELSALPHKEQLHWKQFNISPQKGISYTYYNTMFQGNWAESPETVDLFFKEKYESFNEAWQKKYNWPFYKPLSKENDHNFNSLHVPTTNNKKTFCEQILSLVIVTIDSLNEKEIGKGLILEKNEKGIKKLEKYLEHKNTPLPEMIEFLKHLQNLRSGLVAHRFSQSNESVKKSIEYFNMNGENYIEVAKDIFSKSIHTLNTLENLLLKPENNL